MQEFKSLKPSGLPEDFDAEVHGEDPIVQVLKETPDEIEISFVFPGFTASDDEIDVDGEKQPFTEVGISKTGWLSESGKPLLPSFGRYVQIPPDCAYAVKEKKGRATTFKNVLVTPAQERATDGDGDDEFEFDRDVYAKDELYPRRIVEVSGPFDIDDYRALLVHVRPLQYNAAKRKLVGHSNITVTIRLTAKEAGDEDDDDTWSPADPELDRKAFGNLFVNPTRIERRRPVLRVPLPPRVIDRGPEFLIIHGEDFEAAAKKLMRWKQRKGIETEMVSIATVGNSSAQIKAYVRGKRKAFLSRLRYVLLLGDVDHIEPESVDGNCTDHYYFTSKDPEDGEYVLAWVAGGRIPIRNATQALTVVNQIIRYERTPPADPSYYDRFVVAAYFQDNGPQDGKADKAYVKTMESIRSHLVSLGCEVDRVYVSNNPNPEYYKDGTPIPEEVKAAIVDDATATELLVEACTEGHLIIGHRDHGNWDGWMEPHFKIDDLDAITGRIPSILYSVNCQTGRYDLTAPTECFAEAILAKNGGAPSLLAATENSGTWRNDSLMKAMYDAMYPGVLPTFPGSTCAYPVKNNRLGDILNYGMSYLPIAHSGDTGGIKDHTEIYHVIGDPTLELWGQAPLRMRMRAVLTRLTLKIRFSDCPSGGYLSIWAGNRLLKGMHPQSTQVTIPLKGLALSRFWKSIPYFRRYLTVCFSKPGYRFARVRVRLPVYKRKPVPRIAAPRRFADERDEAPEVQREIPEEVLVHS
ncbi:MAG: C25 family cysteine peptidase [Planctomycetota bacterium]|jgi:hypothetical protein